METMYHSTKQKQKAEEKKEEEETVAYNNIYFWFMCKGTMV